MCKVLRIMSRAWEVLYVFAPPITTAVPAATSSTVTQCEMLH